jgi:hypothetical protein
MAELVNSQESCDVRNREVERQEIQQLQTAPDHIFLYVRLTPQLRPFESRSWARGQNVPTCCRLAIKRSALKCPICGTSCEIRLSQGDVQIITWMGTPVATHVTVGQARKFYGYARSTRRPISCRIFGVQYHGWYMESSGDYCRLKKAKRQPK